MTRQTTLFCLAILILVIGALYWVNKNVHVGGHPDENYDYVVRDLPTSPEVELIEGRPNFDVINEGDGMELIHPGDIALGAGFGIGEGTVGFCRYGSSFMA